jgi:hypothetical protein
MSDPKDNESFFRKVVRFVANPATDWHDLNTRQHDPREDEFEKTELKAMIERKRRNDFVRRREFDMLRRVRREGLTPEQLAALGGSSRLDDSEARASEGKGPRPGGVKAKIDAIEQQMVGDPFPPSTTTRPLSGPAALHSRPQAFNSRPSPLPRTPAMAPSRPPHDDADELPALPPLPDTELDPLKAPTVSPAVMVSGLPPLAPLSPPSPVPTAPPPRAPAAAPAQAPGVVPMLRDAASTGFDVEVSEVAHDPELDEAVIAFANADFEQCEHSLTKMTAVNGPRAEHAETWLVLFDLFRATGQQQRFETLAVEYAHRFGWSAPQWYSLPQLVADAVADEAPAARGAAAVAGEEVGWVCPPHLDTDAVSRLRSQTLQMPLPWVFDWGALRQVDAEAATQLSALCRVWAAQPLEMRWIAGEQLFNALQDAAPTGVRDADPAFWLARLDALRLTNRVDQFDEAAIDYCVTYEVSPPSWEPARCTVHVGGSSLSTRTPPMSMMSEVSTTFFESALHDDVAVELASVELSGQLIGDINDTLQRLTERLGQAPMVSVSCSRLIRVDFLAAGDLLNWVLARRSEHRTVQFTDAHRLIALFFGAMGISEHAQVQVRKV